MSATATELDVRQPPARRFRLASRLLDTATITRWLCLFLGLFLVIVAVAPSLVAPASPTRQELSEKLEGPKFTSGAGLLGRDELGRDVASRIVHGARPALVIGFSTSFLAAFMGGLLGLVAVAAGRVADAVITRTIDAIMALPGILLALLLLSFADPSVGLIIITLCIAVLPLFSRMARSQALAVRENDFVLAARALGASNLRITTRHIAPQILPVLTTLALLQLAPLIIAEATLSYLGVGIQPPQPAWGTMLRDGARFMQIAWWLTVFPGLAIFGTVAVSTVLAGWAKDTLDPFSSQSR